MNNKNIGSMKRIHSLKVCDLTYLLNFSGGDKNFMRQMIELFFKQVPAELNSISQHAGIPENVKSTAHKLKSSVSLVGAESMVVLLKQMEKLAVSGSDKQQILELNKELLQLYNVAQRELETYLEASC